MDNYVTRYQPPIYNGNDTMEGIYSVEGEEVKQINGKITRIIDNNFIKTADLSGIQKYEDLLLMKNNADYDLEERRTNVLNKMLFTPPYTRQKLDEILRNIYGQGGYAFDIYPDRYEVIIDIDTNNPVVYIQFSKDVRDIIPANMYLIIAIQYTYLYLNRRFTYEKMETLTYGELSQYDKEETKTIKELRNEI